MSKRECFLSLIEGGLLSNIKEFKMSAKLLKRIALHFLLIKTAAWVTNVDTAAVLYHTTAASPGSIDMDFKANSGKNTGSVPHPKVKLQFSKNTAVAMLAFAYDMGNTNCWTTHVFVGNTGTNADPVCVSPSQPIVSEGIIKCSQILVGTYVTVTDLASNNNGASFKISFNELRVYSWLPVSLTGADVIPSTSNLQDPNTTPLLTTSLQGCIQVNIPQAPIGQKWLQDDYTYTQGVVNVGNLPGFISAVASNGWSSYTITSPKKEAFLVFKLPSRMLVKVVFVIGLVGGGGAYETPLASHFIGVYDDAAWPPTTTPQVYLCGPGSNRYARGNDCKIDTWGNYVVLWNSISANYMAVAYVAIFASTIDCRVMSTWPFSTDTPPAKSIPYGAPSVSFVPFPNIPAECKPYFSATNPVTFTTTPIVGWISFTYPNMLVIPQAAFQSVSLAWTFTFYEDGFLPATQTGTMKVINEGNALVIGQIPDTTYLLGSNVPIPFPSWHCVSFPCSSITWASSPAGYLIVNNAQNRFDVDNTKAPGSYLITYTGTADAGTPVSLSFTLKLSCDTKMVCAGLLSATLQISKKINDPSQSQTCTTTGTVCAGSAIVPVVTCPTNAPAGLITITPAPPSTTYTATLASVTNPLYVGSFVCTFTYTNNGINEPTWKENLTVRVFCYATSLLVDPDFITPSNVVNMVYDLFYQTLTINGDITNKKNMALAPYSQEVPTFSHSPPECDSPFDKTINIRIHKPDLTFVDYQNSADSVAAAVDYALLSLTVKQNLADSTLTGLYKVVIWATAFESSIVGAATITSDQTTPYTVALKLCMQKLQYGPTLPASMTRYTINFPSGTIYRPIPETATFLANFEYAGVSCATAETAYSLIQQSLDMVTTLATFVSVDAAHNVNMSSNWNGLPGVFKFSLIASGVLDPNIINSTYLFEVAMICDLNLSANLQANIVIDLNQIPSYLWTLPTFTLMPSYCMPTLNAITLEEISSPVQNISFMTLDFAAKQVNINPNILTDTGTYNIRLKTTLNCPNYHSDVSFVNVQDKYVSQTNLAADWVIQITVCAYYIGLGAIPAMPSVYNVNYPSSDPAQSFTASYVQSGYPCLGSPDTGYTVVYESIQLPGQSFTNLAIDAATHVVTITSVFSLLPGTYSFKLKASGVVYPTVQNFVYQFDVKMNCILWVEAAAITPVVVNMGATPYAWTLPTLTLKPSFCTPSLVSLSLVETASQNISFMTLNFATKVVNVVPVDPINLGSYNLKLMVNLSCPTYNNDASFPTAVTNYVFQPDSPTPPTLTLPSTVWSANLIVCRYQLLKGNTLPAMPANFVLTYPSADTATFKADFKYDGFSCGTAETDYAIAITPDNTALPFMSFDALHNVSLTSAAYSGLPGVFLFNVLAKGIIDTTLQNSSFSFTVKMQCILSIAPQVLPNVYLDVYQTPTQTVTLPAITITPVACAPVLDLLVVKEASSKPVNFISLNQMTRVMTITPVHPTDLGTYNIVVQANVSSPVSPLNTDPTFVNQYAIDVFTFQIDVVDLCFIDPVPDATQVDIYYLIDGLNTNHAFTIPHYQILPVCNVQDMYDLTIVPATGTFPAFMSFVDSGSGLNSFVNNFPTAAINIHSLNYADKGLYSFTLRATSTQNPVFTDNTVSIRVWMQCQLTSLTPPPGINGSLLTHVINPAAGYSPTEIQIPFVVSPPECQATLSFSVSPAKPFFKAGALFTIDTQDPADFGTYAVKITASTNSSPSISGTFSSSIDVNVSLICRLAALSPLGVMKNVLHNEKGKPYVPTQFQSPSYLILPEVCASSSFVQTINQFIGGAFEKTLLPIKQLQAYTFEINTIDPAYLGVHQMQLETFIQPSPELDLTGLLPHYQTFEIQIIAFLLCEEIQLRSELLPVTEYEIGSKLVQVKFPEFSMIPPDCDPTLKYELKCMSKITDPFFYNNAAFNITLQFGTLPSFMGKWDDLTGFPIEGTKIAESWNTYKFLLEVTEVTSKAVNKVFSFDVATFIDCQSATFDIPASLPPFRYNVADPPIVKAFGSITDSISEDIGVVQACGPVSVSLYQKINKAKVSELPAAVKFKSILKELQIQTNSPADAGVFELVLSTYFNKLGESGPHSETSIFVIVLDNTTPQTKTTTTSRDESQAAEQVNEPIEKEKKVEVEQALPEVPFQFRGQKLKLRFAKCRIQEITADGVLKIKSEEQVVLVNQGKFIGPDMLDVEFVKNSEEDVDVRMTGFSLIKYDSTEIHLQLSFNDRLLISSGYLNDEVNVHLSKYLFVPVFEAYEVDKSGRVMQALYKDMLMFTLTASLPSQMKTPGEFKQLATLSTVLSSTATAAVGVPIIAQVIAKSALKKLWGYFNTMQLIISFNQYHLVNTPANVQVIEKGYKDIVYVKMIPEEQQNQLLGQFGIDLRKEDNSTKSVPLNQTGSEEAKHRNLFIDSARKSKIMRNQILIATLVPVGIFACSLCYLFRNWICSRSPVKIKKLFESIKHAVIWNGPLRSLLEVYYPMLLGALFTFKDKTKSTAQFASPAIQVFIFLAFTCWTFWFIRKNKDNLDDKTYKAKFGALYTNVETYKKPHGIYFSFVFLARRTLIAFVIFGLQFNVVLQIQLTVHISLLMAGWIINVQPMDTPLKNSIELFNETLILFHSYYSFLFTPYVTDPVTKYTFGYLYSAVLGTGLAFNAGILIFEIVRDFIRARRAKYATQTKVEDGKEPAKEEVKEEAKEDEQRAMPPELRIAKERIKNDKIRSDIREKVYELLNEPNREAEIEMLKILLLDVDAIATDLPANKQQRQREITNRVKKLLKKNRTQLNEIKAKFNKIKPLEFQIQEFKKPNIAGQADQPNLFQRGNYAETGQNNEMVTQLVQIEQPEQKKIRRADSFFSNMFADEEVEEKDQISPKKKKVIVKQDSFFSEMKVEVEISVDIDGDEQQLRAPVEFKIDLHEETKNGYHPSFVRPLQFGDTLFSRESDARTLHQGRRPEQTFASNFDQPVKRQVQNASSKYKSVQPKQIKRPGLRTSDNFQNTNDPEGAYDSFFGYMGPRQPVQQPNMSQANETADSFFPEMRAERKPKPPARAQNNSMESRFIQQMGPRNQIQMQANQANDTADSFFPQMRAERKPKPPTRAQANSQEGGSIGQKVYQDQNQQPHMSQANESADSFFPEMRRYRGTEHEVNARQEQQRPIMQASPMRVQLHQRQDMQQGNGNQNLHQPVRNQLGRTQFSNPESREFDYERNFRDERASHIDLEELEQHLNASPRRQNRQNPPPRK